MIESMVDVKALQLAAGFALKPCTLGRCGEVNSQSKLRVCLTTGECQGLEDEFPKFNTMYPYLKTLSQISGLPPLSYKVVEAYWLGNELLDLAKPEDYDLLVKNFEEQGIKQAVKDPLIQALKTHKPRQFIPFHLFHILYLGIGKTNGLAVPAGAVNFCMVRWGRVEKIVGNRALIDLGCIKDENYPPEITKLDKRLIFDRELLPGLHEDQRVASHWGSVVKVITEEEEKRLTLWTNKVLQSFFL